MWPKSARKSTAVYLENASSPLVFEDFRSRLISLLERYKLLETPEDSQIQILFEISQDYSRRHAAILKMKSEKLELDHKKREALMKFIEKQLKTLHNALKKRSANAEVSDAALLAKSVALRLSRLQAILEEEFTLVRQHGRISASLYRVQSLKRLRREYVGNLDYYTTKCAFRELTQQQRDVILAGTLFAARCFTKKEEDGDIVERIAMMRHRARKQIDAAVADSGDGLVFQTVPKKRP